MRGAPTRNELIYPDHRLANWLTEYASRDRSNRWLDDCARSNGVSFAQSDPAHGRHPCLVTAASYKEIHLLSGHKGRHEQR